MVRRMKTIIARYEDVARWPIIDGSVDVSAGFSDRSSTLMSEEFRRSSHDVREVKVEKRFRLSLRIRANVCSRLEGGRKVFTLDSAFGTHSPVRLFSA